jgi:hypothetical protein
VPFHPLFVRIQRPTLPHQQLEAISAPHPITAPSHRRQIPQPRILSVHTWKRLLFVSFVDLDGIRHSVEVNAESLYEAAALATRTFRQHNCAPGLITKLDAEIRSSVTHTVTLQKVQDWLDTGPRSPREFVLKERLRALLT